VGAAARCGGAPTAVVPAYRPIGRADDPDVGLLAGWAAFGVFWGGWGALLPAREVGHRFLRGKLGLALLFVAAAALPVMPLVGRIYDRLGPGVPVLTPRKARRGAWPGASSRLRYSSIAARLPS
jgi:hypothetical protein